MSPALNCSYNITVCSDYSNNELYDESLAIANLAKILNNPEKYNKIIRPYERSATKKERNPATVVYPKIDILRVGDITMDNVFPIGLYFTQRWKEPRLKSIVPANLKKIRIRGDLLDSLWLPNTIIRNSQESKHPDDYQRDGADVVVLHRDGYIHYTIRLSATCFCRLDLAYYPFDEQLCRVHFESLNHEANELMYNISGHGGPKFASLAPNATVPVQFHLLNNELISQCKPTTLEYPGGEYFSTFCIRLQFVRSPRSVVLRCHIPAMLLVLCSFVSFFIHHEQVAGRVALSLTSFLAMVTLGLVKGPTSEIDFITALDIYQIACIIFIFLTLIEFAIVHYYHDVKSGHRVHFFKRTRAMLRLSKKFHKAPNAQDAQPNPTCIHQGMSHTG
jgi:hypothetical protein